MYSVLLIIQISAMVLSFVCVALILAQKNSELSKYMLVVCLTVFLQNAGYYLEMRAANLQEVMIALRLEYIGAAFIVTTTMLFAFRYCRVKLVNGVAYALVGLDIAVLVCVWCYEYVPLYYSSVDFVQTGIFPHAVLGKGPLYVMYMVSLYAEFIACIVVSAVSALRTVDPNMKKNYRLLCFSVATPLVLYILGIVNVFDGYDTAPIGGAVGILIFAVAIIFRRVFDVVETARENILMEMDDAVVILDYRRGYQEANKAAISIFPELAKTPFGQLVANKEFNALFDNNSRDDLEINGRFYDVHINELYARNGIDSSFIGYSIIFFDTTEKKEQLKKLSELKEAADAANSAKSAFLANVSHEIRTPINVVLGMSEVILRDYEDAKLLGYAQNISNASQSLLELINDILDFSKIESGRVTLSNSEYRVDEFFRDVIMVFETKGAEKNLSFTTGIAKDIPLVLFGDVMRIKQVATNLLSNAFKYTREGGVTFRASFEKISEEKGNLILSVEDTGIGIKKEEIDKVFELFVRLDERLNRSIEGTGLGLNITKELVDKMGGEIKVYSEYGKGSAFTVIIPQFIRSAKGEVIGELKNENVIKEREGIGYTAPNAKVLVIDDSRTNLIVAKALLRDTKAEIATGLSGNDCLNMIMNEQYDVIFLDYRMPEMDGVETLHKMQKMNHKCKAASVIMLTANAASEAKDYYIHEGFADFLSKPITEQSITSMLRKYLPKDKIIEVQK